VHAIRATGALQKQFHLAVSGIPSVDPVVGLVGEEDIPMSIDRRAFRE
jgi:hypothetical protein